MGTARSMSWSTLILDWNFWKKRSINFSRYSPGGSEEVSTGFIFSLIPAIACCMELRVPCTSKSLRMAASFAGSMDEVGFAAESAGFVDAEAGDDCAWLVAGF